MTIMEATEHLRTILGSNHLMLFATCTARTIGRPPGIIVEYRVIASDVSFDAKSVSLNVLIAMAKAHDIAATPTDLRLDAVAE